MALGYKQQQRVEEAWRTMKSGRKMRPVFQWAPDRIRADIAITVLSLLLERTIQVLAARAAVAPGMTQVLEDLERISKGKHCAEGAGGLDRA